MILTTAEASSTNFAAARLPISAGSILPDQLFRGRIERREVLLPGQSLQAGQGLEPALAGITTAGLLQIIEGLLAQAAVMPPCTQLEQLMEWIGHVPNL